MSWDPQLKGSLAGQSNSVKTWRIRQFIEDDFGEDEDLMKRWPKEHGGSIEEWIESWQENDPRTYAWPSAPEGYYYKMIRINVAA